jgi:hypothetical protein
MAKTSRGAQKVAKGLDKVSDVASIPAKLAASGTRKAIKGTALVGSKIAGGVGRTGEAVSKVAALPRTAVTGFASKFIDPKIAGSGILGAQATGALTGAVPGLGLLTGAEALGYIANKTGRGVERTLSARASTGGQKRFLQRLATSADSPRLRKLALMAHSGIGGVGATKLTDLAFNSLVNGASVGVLNGALAYASGEGAEGVGAAVGSGTLMGGSLPFGQPGMKGGKSQAARDQSSINFLNAKLADDQIKQFKKLSPEARLAFATVEEAGIRAPKLAFLDKQTYLDFLRQDDPNLRQAPNAHYDMGDNTIYVNQDGNAGRSSKEAMDILTHELGHHFIKQAIKDDPFFAEKILSEYKAKPGEESFDFAFTTDSAGAPIDSIKLNKKAVDIADLYGGIQDGIGIGRNAEKLAQEIGAEQFAMMMVDNPNIFKTIEPSLRQKLLDGSRKVLTMFGAVDGNTGNPLDISILGKEVRSKNPLVQRSKSIKNLYKNYVKQREYALADKIDLAENPMKIKLQRGEKPQQAVQRLFNTKGISLKEAGAFRINNRKVKEKLVEIKKRLLENPTGGMRAFVNKSGNAIAIKGKTLSDEVRSVFTRNDPFGNINTLINVAQEAIRDKAQLNFLYRSGKPSKYSDNELRPRVISPVGFNITGLSDRSTSAASLKLDSFDEAYLRNNAEVLVQEGFAKDPNALIEEGRRVAKESLTDSEGRINPKGKQENELVTALFGQPESAGFIKNKKLRVLLEEGRLRHAFRSYDFDALAGLVPTGRDGISFDWDNVKHNHMPLDDKLFIPAYHGTPHTFAPEAGAPLGKFRTSAIGTGEGAQAYGHGLYFAGKRDVAEHYRKVLSDKKDDIYQEYDGQPFDRTNPKHEAARRLNKEAKMLGVSKNQVRPRVIDQIKGQLQRRDLDRSVKERLSDVSKVLENNQEAKANEGSLYKVELAPKENEYLLYDKTLGEQPKGVQDKLKKFLREQEGEDTWQYRQEQDYRDITNNVLDDMPEPEISRRLKEAGIPGIKYLDGASRSKGEGDYNYVIFDEADVTVTEKLFMPASEAGAGKGKVAEAAKLWQEKGTDSPFFKKWFGKSKVVDENGEPLVVYRGDRPGKEVFTGRENPYNLIQGNVFFSDNAKVAKFYTDQRTNYLISPEQMNEADGLYGTYLRLKKPLEVDAKENSWTDIPDPFDEGSIQIDDLGEIAQKKGYDGMIIKNVYDQGGFGTQYIAFSPEQIKSATGNRGTFDAGERNILFMPSDSDYLKAVDQGDMQAAQQMVDQKARENGYDVLAFHGTPEGGFDVFETAKQNVKGSNTVDPNTFLGSHFAEDPKVAQKFVDDLYGAKEGKNPQLYKVYLKLEKPLGGDRGKGFNETKAQAEANKKARKKIAEQLKQAHDQVDKINIKTDPSEFLKIMEQKGISEATAEIAKQKKKKNPELFKRIERLNEKLQKIPNTSESIKIDLPGGEAFLSGDRALISEDKFGLQALVKDNMGRDPIAESNVKYDMKRRKELGIKMRKALDELGYDSVVYDNAVEGGIGIIVTDPSQIKSANPVTYDSKGNPIPLSKRFDSSKDSILYMPSDPKAPTRQPANRIQQQAPSMPGNRFMAPAVSAGAKSAERFR